MNAHDSTRRHVCVRLAAPVETLRSSDVWRYLLATASERAGAHVVGIVQHDFGDGGGCSVAVLLSESHASVHTWPEDGIAEVDFYTCGQVDPDRALDALLELGNGALTVECFYDVVKRAS